MRLFIIISVAMVTFNALAGNSVGIEVLGKPLIHYQALPLENPKGNDENPPSDFKGSNFIHPLKTPSGFVVTCIQPDDHLHHFGLWWPWKYIQDGMRKINCWELQAGEGIVQGNSFERLNDGLIAKVDYIDRQADGGPVILLKEETILRAFDSRLRQVNGYFLDLHIQQKTAVQRPIVIPDYRYSGFSIRATEFWNKDNSSIVTSAGKDRYSANFSNARWVLVQGATSDKGSAGILIMSHPGNRAHPEKLRTWDEQNNGAVFVNFNTVGDEPWTYLPGESYDRWYRLLVFDGTLSPELAEAVWQQYVDMQPGTGLE